MKKMKKRKIMKVKVHHLKIMKCLQIQIILTLFTKLHLPISHSHHRINHHHFLLLLLFQHQLLYLLQINLCLNNQLRNFLLFLLLQMYYKYKKNLVKFFLQLNNLLLFLTLYYLLNNLNIHLSNYTQILLF